jgi:hypothetical protein
MGSAHASSPRITALGADGFGTLSDGISLFFDDDRNIFYNPAELNTYNNFAILQEGEGGFFRGGDMINYGFYFGRNSTVFDTANGIFTAGGQAYGDLSTATDNDMLELFVAGDMGVQWGASLYYVAPVVEGTGVETEEFENIGINLGANVSNIDIWVNANLGGEGESDPDTTYEGDLGLRVGAKTELMGWVPFINYESGTAEFEINGTGTRDFERTQISLGVGRTYDVDEGVKVITGVAYEMKNTENDPSVDNTLSDTEVTETTLPIHVGVEAMATSWLTLRAGTQYALVDTYEFDGGEENSFNRNRVDPQLGGTFEFGDFRADFSYAQDFTQSGANNGVNYIGDVAVHYRW